MTPDFYSDPRLKYSDARLYLQQQPMAAPSTLCHILYKSFHMYLFFGCFLSSSSFSLEKTYP